MIASSHNTHTHLLRRALAPLRQRPLLEGGHSALLAVHVGLHSLKFVAQNRQCETEEEEHAQMREVFFFLNFRALAKHLLEFAVLTSNNSQLSHLNANFFNWPLNSALYSRHATFLSPFLFLFSFVDIALQVSCVWFRGEDA